MSRVVPGMATLRACIAADSSRPAPRLSSTVGMLPGSSLASALHPSCAYAHPTAGLAFGGGPYRCPGRFFAEMEVAVVVQLVLGQRDLSLLPPAKVTAAPVGSVSGSESSAGSGRRAGHGSGSGGSAQPHPVLQVLAGMVGPEVAFWGLGVLPPGSAVSSSSSAGAPAVAAAGTGAGASAGAGAAAGEGPAIPASLPDWTHSGDVQGLLPPCDHNRLVGVKVPARPCWVSCKARAVA